jgi:tripartite-type tricarboxylate transporter receptor subunit TctC
MMHIAVSIVALALTAFAGTGPAVGQAYPDRNVTFLVPFGPGGGTDVLARMLAQKLSDKLGKTFVADNRPGPGTVLAAVATANAAPDGYTLMMGTSSTLTINPALYKALPYNPDKLAPVSVVASVPMILTVNPDLPIRSIADLKAYAKASPDKLNYGSVGPGSLQHIATETLNRMLDVNIPRVTYKGGPDLLKDLLAGTLQVSFIDIGSGAGELVRAGKLRALGVSSTQRLASYPEIPPLADVGLPGYDIAGFQVVLVPAGTPQPIVATLNATLNQAIAEADVVNRLNLMGYVPMGKLGSNELAGFMQSERARWAELIKAAGAAGTL